jgi:hypothetical protein
MVVYIIGDILNNEMITAFGLISIFFVAFPIILSFRAAYEDRKFSNNTIRLWKPWYVKSELNDFINMCFLYLIFFSIVTICFWLIRPDLVQPFGGPISFFIIFTLFSYFMFLNILLTVYISTRDSISRSWDCGYGEDIIEIIELYLKKNKIRFERKDNEFYFGILTDLGINISTSFSDDIYLSFSKNAKEKDVYRIMKLVDRSVNHFKNYDLDWTRNHEKYFKRTKPTRKLNLKTPKWAVEKLEFIYGDESINPESSGKSIYRIRKNKFDEYFVEFGSITQSEFNDKLDKRWNDVLPFNRVLKNYYGEFFIESEPKPKKIIKMFAGKDYHYIRTEEVEIPLGKYLGMLYHRKGLDDCLCKSVFNRKGKCEFCEGTGRSWSLKKCMVCNGSGICKVCNGTGEIEHERYLWFETNTGILLKRALPGDENELNLDEHLEKIKPRNILEDNRIN